MEICKKCNYIMTDPVAKCPQCGTIVSGGMVICAFAWLLILLLTQHSFDGGGLETIIGTAIVFFFVVRWTYRALLKRGKQ